MPNLPGNVAATLLIGLIVLPILGRYFVASSTLLSQPSADKICTVKRSSMEWEVGPVGHAAVVFWDAVLHF